jgi:hypothetical protein
MLELAHLIIIVHIRRCHVLINILAPWSTAAMPLVCCPSTSRTVTRLLPRVIARCICALALAPLREVGCCRTCHTTPPPAHTSWHGSSARAALTALTPPHQAEVTRALTWFSLSPLPALVDGSASCVSIGRGHHRPIPHTHFIAMEPDNQPTSPHLELGPTKPQFGAFLPTVPIRPRPPLARAALHLTTTCRIGCTNSSA